MYTCICLYPFGNPSPSARVPLDSIRGVGRGLVEPVALAPLPVYPIGEVWCWPCGEIQRNGKSHKETEVRK